VKDDLPNDELTPLVEAVAEGREVDWKRETRELHVRQRRTAEGLQEIDAIARAHRTLLGPLAERDVPEPPA
jgi:hypothetical protein